MIEYKVATYNDLTTIETIARKTWPDTFGEVMPKVQIDYMLDLIYNENALKEQLANGHVFLIVNYNDLPVGYTSYELNYKDKPHLMIHKVYLLPSSQGLGLGKKTFDHLTRIALDNNQEALTLKVFYKNDKATGFYMSKGFKKIGVEETDIGNGYVILDDVLVKQIT